MTTNELTSVAIKVFAIYILVHAILSIPTFIATFSGLHFDRSNSWTEQVFWLLSVSSIVLLLIVTVLVWKLAGRVVEKAPSAVEKSESCGIDEAFLLSLLGIYLCVEAVMRFQKATPDSPPVSIAYTGDSDHLVWFYSIT